MSEVAADGIEARVVRVTMEVLSLEGDPPPLESRITDDLGADSIDLFSLVSALEDEFGGSIEEEEMDALETLSDVVDYVRRAHAGVQ